MTTTATQLPPMPVIGLPEKEYVQLVHDADRTGDLHGHEAYKVGQYVSLAMNPKLPWPKKLRYFEYALHHHCNPPPLPDEPVWLFYAELKSLVRDYCGQEALRLASEEDDIYASRLRIGTSDRARIAEDAKTFFPALLGREDHCPDYFHEEDWHAIAVFRDQWV